MSQEARSETLITVLEALTDSSLGFVLVGGGLDHRFKSLFGHSTASTDDLETLRSFLDRQRSLLDRS